MKKTLIEIYKLFFLRPGARKFNQFVLQCAAHGLGILNYRDMRDSGEEYLLAKYLPRALSPEGNHTLFDVGANVGSYSRALRANFPSASIHAFEPHPLTFSKLVEESKDSRLNCVNMGLSDEPAESVIYEKAEGGSSTHNSLYRDVFKKNTSEGKINSKKIILTSIDEYAKANGIDQIDLLKVDTEGHEFSILKGAKRMLQEKRIRIIQLEFNEMNLYSHTTMRDIRDMLPSFDFYRLSPRGLIALPDLILYQEIYQFQNILCVANK